MKQHDKMPEDDPRYRVANREALLGVGLVIINFILWYGFAYGIGSKPVEEYSYIWGLPAWFFYSCIIGTVIIISLVILAVVFLFKEVPFDEEGDE
ncbi:sodium:pantothenate symporter [Alkalihalobacillus macyae]|uniref:Sodium:pantothenate symporter n=2 Tax=Guptibacillus hwajinpoensis TaxID=208199 RepID=A0A0J6FR76_9BACL|nr:YhdT family protein [Alkalihalobacillus macyae]KMM36832.1 sodium:pantothenate symporter [Alkalihalobacillus macyae]